MSLATRCTDCGTVFRVVEDQLKVSEGWVRCGRCSAVFNAMDALVDLDSSAAGALPAEPAAQAYIESDPPAAAPPRWLDPVPEFAPTLAPTPAPTLAPPPSPEPIVADASASMLAEDRAPAAIVAFGAGSEPAIQIDADEASAAPSFLQAAERAEYWRRPRVRVALAAAAAALALLAAAQAAVIWRDLLAAKLPALKPALAALCQPIGCRLSALRRIDRISVDASGLTRVEGAPMHRLQLVLRNHADIALAAPALELTLSDGQGKLVARRVLQPAELGVTTPAIAPGKELTLQAVLATGQQRISGYTVELFYP